MRAAAANREDAPIPYVPVDGAPWRLSMGLRRLEPRAWLEVDDRRNEELAHKRALLRDARDEVLCVRPDGLEAAAELHELVVAYLVEHHPELVRDNGVLLDPGAAPTDGGSRHPIEAASLLIQEDLCVLRRDDTAWRLVAACVCFPSRWSLTSKIGETLADIHGPVPGFDRELARPATTFFDRLSVERPVWRLNWTLLDTPQLHLPSAASRRRAPDATTDLGRALWFRVERQTLRRLARTGAITFTIRTYVAALDALVATDPAVAGALRATLRTVDDDVAAYKGWTQLLAPLDVWLAAREDAGEGAGPEASGHDG